jgi:hypothetical protein
MNVYKMEMMLEGEEIVWRMWTGLKCEISGSYGGMFEDDSLLGYSIL